MNLFFKTEQDHIISRVKTHYDLVIEKYHNFKSLVNSFSQIENNYHRALTELSNNFNRSFDNSPMVKSSYIYFKKIIDIKINHSLTLSNEMDDIVKTDLKKFSSEMSFGFSNIFKDIRYIKNRLNEMKQDVNFSEEKFKKNQTIYFESLKNPNPSRINKKKLENPKILHIKSLKEIKKASEVFQKQQIKIGKSLKYYENKCLDFSREMIMKLFIHNISHLKNIEYDLSNVIEDFKKYEKITLDCKEINKLDLVDPIFYENTKKEIYKLENSFLYNQVQDEMYKIYDLTKFANETLILSKLFENEKLSTQENLKLRSLCKSQKSEADIFFVIFLENMVNNRNKKIFLNEENYSFLRDMVWRIFVRKFLKENSFISLFNLTYYWQFIYVTENKKENSFYTIKDLKNEEFMSIEDFWFQALFKIFSPIKNDYKNGYKNIIKLCSLNYNSCLNFIKNKRKVNEIFSKIMDLNLGCSLNDIITFKNFDNNINHLVFFKKEDISESKSQNSDLLKMNIF